MLSPAPPHSGHSFILEASPEKAPVLRVDSTPAWREKIGRKTGIDEVIEAQNEQLSRGNSKWQSQD